ncbi:uncharacterized protein UTRI_03413 [Ustilago trichophora]|uniref:Ubiquitin-like-conjugating enzyme ATG10 n=1 Tax=Ustilago trichophora TaxID=86804 RepID=A0A5C3E1K6_9BASI|nr:uncharacterized protein UTRI_03413 [Ustilago trichophora]
MASTPTTSIRSKEVGQSRITSSQFERYARAYLAKRDAALASCDGSNLGWLTYARRWQWLPAVNIGLATIDGSACLHRTFTFLTSSISYSASVDLDLEAIQLQDSDPHTDTSQASNRASQMVTVTQTIAYAKTWQVPVFYFHANTSSGEPVPLEMLKSLDIVHRSGGTLPEKEAKEGEMAGGLEGAISVGDHPRSGLPCFYLHPCQTSEALNVLLRYRDVEEGGKLGDDEEGDQIQVGGAGRRRNTSEGYEAAEGGSGEEDEGWTYLSSFITLCGSAVEMRAC